MIKKKIKTILSHTQFKDISLDFLSHPKLSCVLKASDNPD